MFEGRLFFQSVIAAPWEWPCFATRQTVAGEQFVETGSRTHGLCLVSRPRDER